MGSRYTSLIFFFVFCENCMFMTWSASNEDDQNRLSKQKFKSSIKPFLNLGQSDSVKGQKDEKGKGLAVEDDTAEAGPSTSGKHMLYTRWTNEQSEDLLRYFYCYRNMRLCRKRGRSRDWEKISTVWNEKYGNLEMNQIRSHAYSMREKIRVAAEKFDAHHPNEIGSPWIEYLTDDLMRIYYETEKGDKSKHGERMLAEWVEMKHPGYQNVTPEYLFNRVKATLKRVKKITPADLNSEEPVLLKHGEQMIFRKDHQDYLKELWKKYRPNMKNRAEQVFNDAIAKFKELEPVGITRLYSHARLLYQKDRKADVTSGFSGGNLKKRESKEFIIDGYVNWKPEHDDYLLELWRRKKRADFKDGQLEHFHKRAAQEFPEFGELHPKQLYDHVRYLRRKAKISDKKKIVNQETMQEAHVPYHHFIDDESTPWSSQRIDHHHEWMASTSSHPGPSHSQPDVPLDINTLSSGEENPDTKLKL